MIIEILWLVMLAVNTLPYGAYIMYITRVARNMRWNIRIDPRYEPNLTVIVPTFEEELTIQTKLDNIADTDYPKKKMQVLIVDSASKDRTVSLAQDWSRQHPETRMQIITQHKREGMVNALNQALDHLSGDLVVKTDSDCLWYKDSLKNVVKYAADPSVGAVAGLHTIRASKENTCVKTERTYREFYDLLRIGESKLFSTVLYEGELMAVKRELLVKVGFDEHIGADDVPMALKMAELGYRAISAEDAYFIEKTPHSWKEKFRQKIRRGRHVFQALWKYKYLILKEDTVFHKLILPFETYIYVVNPFVTILFLILSIGMVLRYPWMLLLLIPILLVRRIRELFLTHLVNSIIMVLAVLAEIRRTEKTVWQKSVESREQIATVSAH
jgi:poly-beta-1,6-N-acetyl-D-glucosamine synthase